jgi:membrane protein DedA with SNARE-associated domain
MAFTDELLVFVERHRDGLGPLCIGVAALLKFALPPFPGDVVVLFGAFLVARRGWPLATVYLDVLLGSVIGFMLHYYVGRWLGRSESRWSSPRFQPHRRKIDRIFTLFEERATLVLILNRFLPLVRSLAFLAAGMAPLPAWKVLATGLVGAAIWYAALFMLAATLGASWDTVRDGVEQWLLAGGCALVGAALIATGVYLWLRRARRREGG